MSEHHDPSRTRVTGDVFLVLVCALLLLLSMGCGPPGSSDRLAIDTKPKAPEIDLAQLKARAEQGDSAARNQLGEVYLRGEGVPMDLKAAAKLFQLSAEQGYPGAQYNLAMFYEAGQGGLPADFGQAAGWYRKAADQGHAGAQYCLASAYAYGRGVARNDAESLKWLRAAATGGEGLAQFALGMRYQKGTGVARDLVEAAKWLRLAAGQSTPDAAEALKTVESGMSREQIAEAVNKAARFVPGNAEPKPAVP
jgi:TPR repeat protein